jgi:hypothetical protein
MDYFFILFYILEKTVVTKVAYFISVLMHHRYLGQVSLSSQKFVLSELYVIRPYRNGCGVQWCNIHTKFHVIQMV